MTTKIMHILDSLNIGGLENGVINLINRMDWDSFSHTLCCIRDTGDMSRRIQRKDVKIFNLNTHGRDRWMFWKLKKLIAMNKPDIVHTRNFGTIDGIISAAIARVPKIIYGEHGLEVISSLRHFSRENWIRRLLLLRVNTVIAVSDAIRSWLIRTVKIPKEKVRTILNGVDSDTFIPPKDKASAKKKLGLNPNAAIIGTVGRLDKIKNYKMLLESVSMIDGSGFSFEVVLVGDGPEKSFLENIARRKDTGNVYFVGSQERVVDYLQAFDLFVLPSFSEGISNTILEAMACAIHVIATNVGGNPEIIEHNINGTLVPSDDAKALAESITYFLSNPSKSKRIGQAARDRCTDSFSLKRMVKQYERLYMDLLN